MEAKWELRRIPDNNSIHDSLEWTVRIQPDEEMLPIFFSSFSDSDITQPLFRDKSLQRHPFWMTPTNQSPMQLETETGAAQTISHLNCLCESCLQK